MPVPAFLNNLGTNNSKSTGTTLVITTTAAVAAGKSILVVIGMDPPAGTVSGTDSAGNSYASAGESTTGADPSVGVRLVILAAHNVTALPSGGTITITHPSLAARAASAASFEMNGTGAAARSTPATGGGTAPTVSTKTSLLQPLVIGAVATEGPVGDTYTEDANYTALTGTGTSAGQAASNVKVNWGWHTREEETDHVHSPTLGTSRSWVQLVLVLDTTTARIRLFREKEGFHTSNVPGTNVVDAGITYNPLTTYASALWLIVHHDTLQVYYALKYGSTVYGGTAGNGETMTSLPATSVYINLLADASTDIGAFDVMQIDFRVPA